MVLVSSPHLSLSEVCVFSLTFLGGQFVECLKTAAQKLFDQ